jgi:hypothetical protein
VLQCIHDAVDQSREGVGGDGSRRRHDGCWWASGESMVINGESRVKEVETCKRRNRLVDAKR